MKVDLLNVLVEKKAQLILQASRLLQGTQCCQ